ncbi:BQ5605_C005g03173 [Microbotryum silenes-dioicae]|uniref:BQ5605_C005g03173 protein n=1 Tax=Microbotryum silenes-dioicae TaxID=796604 RepID=A0A2X0P5E7_9BASI|nr:BQ5605_C005g03173 [Microbotryum silenes-dioicae]
MPGSTSEANLASSTTLQEQKTVGPLDPTSDTSSISAATSTSTFPSLQETEPTRTPPIPISKMTSTSSDLSQPFPVPPSVTPPSPSSGFSTSPRHHFRMCDVLGSPELQSGHSHSNSLTNAAELWWKSKGDGNGLERVTVLAEWNRSGSESSATASMPEQGQPRSFVSRLATSNCTEPPNNCFRKARPATPIAASNDVVVVVGQNGTNSALLHNTAASPNDEEAVGMNNLRRRGGSSSDLSCQSVNNVPVSEPVI